MKYFYLLILIINTQAFATPADVLKCLGREEAYLHKEKIGGAFYELNKSMISFVVQFSETTRFKDQFKTEICQEEKFPSFHLLRLFLTENQRVLNKDKPDQPGLAASSKKSIAENSLRMFLQFLSHYEADIKKPGCLQKAIPQLKNFYEKTLYLQENITPERLIKELKSVDVIMDNLLSPNLTRDC